MKLNPLLSIPISISILIFSCQKDDIVKTTSKRVKDKWQIDSLITTQKINNKTTRDVLAGTPADYVEFRSDGRMHTHFQGKSDYSSYSIKDGNTLMIGGDAAYIHDLTEKKFIIYTKAEAGSLGFIEIVYHLSK